MSGVDLFKKDYPQIWENIQDDPLLEKDPYLKKEKKEFINHLKRFAGGDLKEHVEIFFNSTGPLRKLRGPEAPLEVNEVLGHIDPVERFKQRMQHTCSMTYDDAERFMDEWLSIEDGNQRLSTIKNDVGSKRLSNRMMWAFQNVHDKTDPFNNGIELKKMPCVLGLEPGSYLRFAYRLPSTITAKVPTAFDAGIEAAWRPGGKTRPLDECRSEHGVGFSEVVHGPSTFSDLTQPLEELE